jgi:hypothetical protein
MGTDRPRTRQVNRAHIPPDSPDRQAITTTRITQDPPVKSVPRRVPKDLVYFFKRERVGTATSASTITSENKHNAPPCLAQHLNQIGYVAWFILAERVRI